MNKEVLQVEYDHEIENLMTQLFSYRLKGIALNKQEIWEDVFENLKLCHQWLNMLEAGQGHDNWWFQIAEGIQIAKEDLKTLLA